MCRHSEESCAAARRGVAPRRRVESRPALSSHGRLTLRCRGRRRRRHGGHWRARPRRCGAFARRRAAPRHGDLPQLQLARSWRAGNGKVDASAIYTAARRGSIDDFVERAPGAGMWLDD